MITVKPDRLRNNSRRQDTRHPETRRRDGRWVVYGRRRERSVLLVFIEIYNSLRETPSFSGSQLLVTLSEYPRFFLSLVRVYVPRLLFFPCPVLSTRL